MKEMLCPDCLVERADYEGPNGAWLPTCPNCGSDADPAPSLPSPLKGEGGLPARDSSSEKEADIED